MNNRRIYNTYELNVLNTNFMPRLEIRGKKENSSFTVYEIYRNEWILKNYPTQS